MLLMIWRPLRSTLFPYTTLFRSDVDRELAIARDEFFGAIEWIHQPEVVRRVPVAVLAGERCAVDRKSTRLNSSHVEISYAVFCLKKKNKHSTLTHTTQ